jgi:hypothetical protein
VPAAAAEQTADYKRFARERIAIMRHSIFLLLLLASPAFSAEPVYTWQTRADDPDRVYLYRDGTQIGGWCYRAGHYRPFDGETWGQPTATSPVQPPTWSSAAPMVSWQNLPRRRGLRGRIDAAIDDAIRGYINSPRFLSGLKFDLKLFDSLGKDMYLTEVFFSARLFAYIEMGGKLNEKIDSDDYRFAKELMTKGIASRFLSERARFAEKLKEEKFANPVLTKISFDVEDDNLDAWKLIELVPEAKLPSRLLFNARNWREDPESVTADTPAVLLLVNRRAKDAKEKIPVTVHCSFVFTALKDGRAFEKTLSYDLYLESLERQKNVPASYPWRVRNLNYK